VSAPTCAPRERLATANDIADFLNVTPKWVYSACRLYDMPHYKVGRYKRFSPAEVMAWLENRDLDDPEPTEPGRSS